MNVSQCIDCLRKGGRQEIGIPLVLPSFVDAIQPLMNWAMTGSPVEARQMWFCVGNATEIWNSLPKECRGRILPIPPSRIDAVLKRGPFDSLLLPKHGFSYSDPTMILSPFWRSRGSYVECSEFQSQEVALWFWKSNRKPLKLFGLDHHHAVLWDAKQILRPLGVTLDFVWLCDGRPQVNEALACQIPGFLTSLDIYKQDPSLKISAETKKFILEDNYDGVITSHSLVTCHRLKELGLPMIHINSTRFGNEWIQSPEKHKHLVTSIQELLQQNRLRVVHNNQGDQQYFHQYFPSLSPSHEVWIPSLCESFARLRLRAPSPTKVLLWDTRQLLLQEGKSPFMKEMFVALKQRWNDAIDSQAILMAQAKTYLAEGYLDAYTAVIHIPYNISTMSMFQQVRANIPIWVPTKRLLKQLWLDPKEPNEMSWTVFTPGSEANASTMDNVRQEDVIERWLSYADFYKPDVLPLVFQFDSIQELVEKVLTTEYQAAIDKAEKTQQTRRENSVFAWEQVLQGLNK